jgi:peptidoglycan DL-endopeptidase CwlO
VKSLAAVIATAVVLAPNAQAVPIVGGGGLTPNAWALANYIQANYPGVQSIGGVRQDPWPDHPSGRAIDVMVGGNTALGNQIYADIMGNPGRFGISYALWQTRAHFDHIHFTVA